MRRQTKNERSFTLVELLIVVAIIALLIGLLLPALSAVTSSSKQAATIGTMQEFAAACNRFFEDHGFYPGLVPEEVLAYHNHEVAHDSATIAISGTENALMHLQGGYAVRHEMPPSEYDALLPIDGWLEYTLFSPDLQPFVFKFNRSDFGSGPIIGGKRYDAYLNAGSGSIRIADQDTFNQWPLPMDDEGNDAQFRLPDLVDGWGTPILYLREAREIGPLGGDAHIYNVYKPRFMVDVVWPYVRGRDQMWISPASGGDGSGSILSTGHPNYAGGFGPQYYYPALARIVQHGAFSPDDPQSGTPRGPVMIISAGADGIYFSAIDGPGSPDAPIGAGLDYDEFLRNPKAIDLFDDIRVATGGS